MKNVVVRVLLLLAAIVLSSATDSASYVRHMVDGNAGFDAYNPKGDGDVYDVGASGVFAKISASTICASSSSQALEDWTCEGCVDSGIKLTEITRLHDPDTDGFGFVGYEAQKSLIVVAFRGSHTIKNWISDLTFDSIPFNATNCEGCRVHHGFVDAYSRLRNQMLSAVFKLIDKYPLAAVTVTGHSLGAALAGHALVDLYSADFVVSDLAGTKFIHSNNGYDENAVFSADDARALGAKQVTMNVDMASSHYNFGMPRIGNPEFATFFMKNVKANVYRLIHAMDPVPNLPYIAFGYSHPPTEVFWSEDSTSYSICSSINGEDPNCADGYNKSGRYGVLDHLTYSGYYMTGRKC